MKIALLTDGVFPYVNGGMQRHSYYLLKYFTKNKIYVDLYHMTESEEYDIHKLEFFTEEEKKYIRPFVVEFPYIDRLPSHYLRESYLYSSKIYDILHENLDVDFIYAQGFSGWRLIKEKNNGLKCPPIGTNLHGLNMFQPAVNMRGKLEAFMFFSPALFNTKNSDFVFSYGGKVTEIIRQLGIPEKKIIEVPTGIEPSWLLETPAKKASGIRKILFIGRYDRVKGIIELNQAIREMAKKYSFEVHFIGPFPDEKKIISPRVFYHGKILDNQKLQSLIINCDVLICPSHSEGMPNVILEAMSRGLAIAATDVGAINCMVSDKNGWLINRCSVSNIKKLIEEIIDTDDKTLQKKKEASIQIVRENFLWDKIAEILIGKLTKIITKKQASFYPLKKNLKRVALLTDGIHPYVIGGMQKHSFNLAKYFAKNEIHIDLYHTSQSKAYDIEKLEFFTDKEKKFIRPIVVDFPNIDNWPGHYLRESHTYSSKIFELLKDNLNIDFIYAKGFTAWKLLEEKQKGFKSPPVGVKFHGLEMFQVAPSVKEKASQYMFHSPTLYNLKHADYTFSYGGKITDILRAKGIAEEKIIEIPTGISTDWLLKDTNDKKGNEHIKFLFIGRYERRKGIEELIESIKNIIEKVDFEFHFIGPIPENKRIHSPKIRYWEVITDKDELQNIISQMDILVCPSHSEGMPNVILEGMASGLAIIATNVGAINELVSFKNGWLINSPSVSEIEQALLSAVKCGKNKLQEKKENSKMIIENNFLWERIITQTIYEIEKII